MFLSLMIKNSKKNRKYNNETLFAKNVDTSVCSLKNFKTDSKIKENTFIELVF